MKILWAIAHILAWGMVGFVTLTAFILAAMILMSP